MTALEIACLADKQQHYVPGGYAGMPIEIIDQGLARMNPLKRVGVPADIAKAVSLLVSPESEWINGTLLIPLLSGFSSKKVRSC
jgi:NAD(P)-dependent dehydrogenase (short-subunit alcohol dehydrogenase family)